MSEHGTNTRKTLTVARSPFERCAELKREGESWSEFLHRAADALETDTGRTEHESNTLTEDHIDDIATAAARRTAEELEAKLRH